MRVGGGDIHNILHHFLQALKGLNEAWKCRVLDFQVSLGQSEVVVAGWSCDSCLELVNMVRPGGSSIKVITHFDPA